MTSQPNEQPEQPTRAFVSLNEAVREPRFKVEETDDEILAWMSREVEADKETLDLLAQL